MTHKRLIVATALVVVAVVAGMLYVFWNQVIPVAGLLVNYFRSSEEPAGTLTIETAPSAQGAAPATAAPSSPAPSLLATSLDWPSYNRTLTSDRYSPLGQIDRDNVGTLKVLCIYDTKEHTSFETGPIVVDGALIGTTEHDIYSIDPATCRENWRTHEDYLPASPLSVNRGAA